MQNSRILIIGGSGFIGKNLSKLLTRYEVKSISNSHEESNYKYLLGQDFNKKILEYNPSIAIIAAGIGNIKKCEEEELAYQVNVTDTIKTINNLKELGVKVIFLSTTAVFSHDLKSPNEMNDCIPDCKYGLQKLTVESHLRNAYPNDSLVIRLTKIVNNVRELNHLISNNYSELELFSDLFIAPISIQFLAKFLDNALEDFKPGIVHLSCKEDISYYELALKIAERVKIKTKISSKICKKFNLVYKPESASLTTINADKELLIQNIDSVIEDLIKYNVK